MSACMHVHIYGLVRNGLLAWLTADVQICCKELALYHWYSGIKKLTTLLSVKVIGTSVHLLSASRCVLA